MHNATVGPKSLVVAYNTDSIKVLNPLDIALPEDPKPGDIREEETCKVRGTPFDEIVENLEYIYKKPEWKMVETDKSCLVTGMPGSGKTYDAKEHYDDKTIAFTFTNKASDVLKSRGVENSHTFDSFFTEQAHNKPMKRLEAYNRIIVDEFSMVPSKFYTKLMQIKTKYPHIIFRLYGDCNQCKPVEELWYDSMTNPLILHIERNLNTN